MASGRERVRVTSNSHVPRVAPPDEVEDLVRFDGIHVAAHAKMVERVSVFDPESW
jgi:hypothetical protein